MSWSFRDRLPVPFLLARIRAQGEQRCYWIKRSRRVFDVVKDELLWLYWLLVQPPEKEYPVDILKEVDARIQQRSKDLQRWQEQSEYGHPQIDADIRIPAVYAAKIIEEELAWLYELGEKLTQEQGGRL